MAKKQSTKTRNFPAKQGNNEVGYGKPPKQHQWKSGQSGNPKGPPKHRTQLWTYFCQYMGMTDAERAKLDKSKLTASQETALKMVENAVKGKGCGSERMARYVVDREEGKAAEHLILDRLDILSDEECEEIRQVLQKNYGCIG